MAGALPSSSAGARIWPRTALTVWLVAGLVISVRAYLKPQDHTLFPIYVTGIRTWWDGADLYARQPGTNEFYRYSPTFAVLGSPFALLPPRTGNVAWKLTNAAVFALGLWVWCRRGLPVVPTANLTAGVFLVAFVSVVGNLANGQANLMMTGFVLLGLSAAARDRWWPAAGFLAAATLLKVFPLALALVLSVLFWRTFPLRFVVALAAGLALPLATQRPEYVVAQTGHTESA